MNEQLVTQLQEIGLRLGLNGLPYPLPIHPNLVHFTLGLFIIAIFFDLAGTMFPLEKPILRHFNVPVLRSSFYLVGWYNLVGAAVITIFTVAAGFFEMLLAQPEPSDRSIFGLGAGTTMVLHGVGGVLLFGVMLLMAVWRGFQRYRWRKDEPRQVQWSYLLVGLAMYAILFVHGTLGAQLGDEFGVHNTAARLIRQGKNPNLVLTLQKPVISPDLEQPSSPSDAAN